MKKIGKMLLTFIVAMMIGILLHIVTLPNNVCEYFCPRNYPPPSEGRQCRECCYEKCPTMGGNIGQCYLNCSAKV